MTARSRWLAGSSAALAAFAIVRAPARAAQFTYKLGHPNPSDFPVHVRLVQMANAVKAETNGRMEIQIFPNGELGSQIAMIEQVRLGSIQFYNSGNSLWQGVVPVSAIDSIGFAFNSESQPLAALDGALGAYIRKEFAAKDLYVFEKAFTFGMRQTTSSTHPIRNAADFAGFKIRIAPVQMVQDMFKTLGAAPVALDANVEYTGLQTHVADGQETPLVTIESYRFYEVQKYLSLTNHVATCAWLVANGNAWNALPPDIQAIVNRNVSKYALLERRDIPIMNVSLSDKLRRQGMIFNTAETGSMRARLGPYYERWKNVFGATAWGLLESASGNKLG